MVWVSDKIFDLLGSNGIYIECGANDGVSQSNTLRLEREKGWRGLLIEAWDIAMDKCKESRSPENIFVNRILTCPEKHGTMMGGNFGDGPMGLTGAVCGDGNILASTLTSILMEHNITKVDFFSLDVEGYELEVLKGLDVSYCAPEMILVEIWDEEKEGIMNFMRENGYDDGINFSGFTRENSYAWNGRHNDYLFRKKI